MLDEAVGLGVAISACQTGLAMADIDAGALDARIGISGLVGILATLDEGRLITA